MAREYDGFVYTCNVNTIFEYMNNEIEFAISNKVGFITEFIIEYNEKQYNIDILNTTDYKKNIIEIDIRFNNEHYKTLVDFMTKVQLNGIFIKDIKENVKVILTHCDSNYLKEHEVIVDKPIHSRQFKYGKSYCNTLLFCGVFFVIFAIMARWMFKGQPGVMIGYIFFDSLAILTMCGYFNVKRKKIIYKENCFIKYGIFGKKTYLVSNIAFVIEKSIKGVIITFNNNKKIVINPFMVNYTDVRRILKQNNIDLKD